MSTNFSATPAFGFKRLNVRAHRDEIERLWKALASQAEKGSFFLSWAWMATWLDSIPKEVRVDFVLVEKGGEPYSCFFLGVRRGLRHWFFYKTRAYLNETGYSELDDLVIEYNGQQGATNESIWPELLADSLFADIEELHFNNVTPVTCGQRSEAKSLQISAKEQDCHYVDLEKIRASGKNHLAFLSASKRRQVRQSLAYYSASGSVQVREAEGVEEALGFLDHLSDLHQQRWAGKGKPGSFASAFFRRFHRMLIENCFAAGNIQLLEFSSAGGVIGYLYNFVQGKEVLFYQSGFSFEADKQSAARPGFVCHHLAIEYNLAKGMAAYNFLAGDAQYKRSLSTDKDCLQSVSIVRNNLKWKLEEALLALKRTTGK